MDYLQKRYDELDLIIRTLDNLIDEIHDKDYISQLEETIYYAQKDIEEIEPMLQEEYDKEERRNNDKYERDAL